MQPEVAAETTGSPTVTPAAVKWSLTGNAHVFVTRAFWMLVPLVPLELTGAAAANIYFVFKKLI